MTNKKQLVWWGPVFSYSGYAQHNRGIIFELLKLGWDIRLLPTESDIPDGLIGKDRLQSLTKNTHIDLEQSICINLVPPPALPQWGKYTILYTTMETKTVHPGFLNRVQQYDEVWVPCRDNYISLAEAMTKNIPMKVIPEGVDTLSWPVDARPDERYNKDIFTFMFCGDWSYRKGNDILIRAYAEEFGREENVRLLLFVHYQGNGPERTYPTVAREIQYFKNKFKINYLPKIEIIGEHHTDAEMPGIFACADVGFFPTRGEACMLPGIQFMALGIPIITSDWGGQTDYCNNKNSYLIKTEKFDTIDDKVNCMVDFQKGMLMAFPDLDDTKRLLRLAYEREDVLVSKSQSCLRHIRKDFDWKQAGEYANERLLKILAKL